MLMRLSSCERRLNVLSSADSFVGRPFASTGAAASSRSQKQNPSWGQHICVRPLLDAFQDSNLGNEFMSLFSTGVASTGSGAMFPSTVIPSAALNHSVTFWLLMIDPLQPSLTAFR